MTNVDYGNSYKRVFPSRENALLVLFPDRDRFSRGIESKEQGQEPSIRSAAPMRAGSDIPYTQSPMLDAGILHS